MSSRVFVSHDLGSLAGPDHDPLASLRRIAALEIAPAGAGPLSRAALLAGVAEADGLLCVLTDRVDADLFAAAPRLRAVSTISVGVDHIDLVAARAREIAVGHTPGVLTDTTAELAFALLMAAMRRLGEAERFVRAGHWRPDRPWAPDMFVGRDLAGATLGIVGLGAIGQAVAQRARAFGMRVIGWSRTPRAVEGVEAVELDELLERADAISLHVALTDETRHLIGRDALERMKPDAVLVNTARGPVVDEAALCEALDAGRLAGVGLDVFETEPLAPTSRLLAHERVVLAPHIGSATIRTRRKMVELAVDNLVAALEGRAQPHSAL